MTVFTMWLTSNTISTITVANYNCGYNCNYNCDSAFIVYTMNALSQPDPHVFSIGCPIEDFNEESEAR